MSRYSLADPKCRHRATVRISSHADLRWVPEGEAVASTYCCDREPCQEDAREWVRASTRRGAVLVVPLLNRGGAAVTPPPDPDDTRPAPEDRCIHCGGWGVFDFGDSEGDCGHCDGTGIEPT